MVAESAMRQSMVSSMSMMSEKVFSDLDTYNGPNDILNVPKFIRSRSNKKTSLGNLEISLDYDASPKQEEPIQMDKRTEEIFEKIDPDNIALYLSLFDNWYQKHGRLPRKVVELEEMGLPEEIVSLFSALHLRKQVKILVLELYSHCDHFGLSDEFVDYLEGMRHKKEGIIKRAMGIARQLF